ncbi:MAG: hypothetical protein VCD66_07420 [Alphaproteobacteria bacterium]
MPGKARLDFIFVNFVARGDVEIFVEIVLSQQLIIYLLGLFSLAFQWFFEDDLSRGGNNETTYLAGQVQLQRADRNRIVNRLSVLQKVVG